MSAQPNPETDIEKARSALLAIPPDIPHADWVRIGMAAHAAGLSFDDFDEWSSQAPSYEQRAARDAWRSFKPGGGIGRGTLFHEAKLNGWRDANGHQRPSAEERAERQRKADEQAARDREAIDRERQETAKHAAAILDASVPARADHPYLVRKGVTAVSTLREIDAEQAYGILAYRPKAGGEHLTGRLLVVPVKQGDTLSTVELIDGDASKTALAGRGTKAGGFWATERLPGGDRQGMTLLIGEGVATVLSASEATGHPAIAALSSGNLMAVAQAMRGRYPAAELVLLADLGKADGKPDPHAIEAARAVGGKLAVPDFGADREPGMTDFNDMAVTIGMEAVRRAIGEAEITAELGADMPLLAKAAKPLTMVRFDDLAYMQPEPPRFIWDGVVPAGFVTLLGAHGGTGKSTIALMLGISVALGRPLFGIDTHHGNVILFSGEDGAQLLRYRMASICRGMGVDVRALKDRLHIIDAADDPVLFSEQMTYGKREGVASETFGALSDMARELEARLVVVDNASDTYDASEIDRARVRGFMRELSRLARDNDAGVLLLAHVDKGTSRGDRNQNAEAYSGSTAWHNSARSRLAMSRTGDGGIVIEHQKSNLGRCIAPIRLEWPVDGVPHLDAEQSPIDIDILSAGNKRALLRLIAEYTERGEYVTTATSSRTHAGKLFRREPTFPLRMKDTELFDLLRQAERAGLLARAQYKGPDRKDRERWEVTAAGRVFAELPAATAATSRDYQVAAPGALTAEGAHEPAATAATSPPRGMGGKARTYTPLQSPQNDAPNDPCPACGGEGCSWCEPRRSDR